MSCRWVCGWERRGQVLGEWGTAEGWARALGLVCVCALHPC